jgi:hypothetical protein
MSKLIRLSLATLTFVFFFYSTTLLTSRWDVEIRACLCGGVSVTGSFCLKDFLSNPYSRILRESVRMPIPQLLAVSAMLP